MEWTKNLRNLYWNLKITVYVTIPQWLFTVPIHSGWLRVGGDYTQTYYLVQRARHCTLSEKSSKWLWHTLYIVFHQDMSCLIILIKSIIITMYSGWQNCKWKVRILMSVYLFNSVPLSLTYLWRKGSGGVVWIKTFCKILLHKWITK